MQFLHPGAEHLPDSPGVREWTRIEDGHARKYLRCPGRCLRSLDGTADEGEIGFWGEWEPPSRTEAMTNPLPDGPRWIHRPYWSRQTSYRGLQNTDPFVFGDRFFYTGCLQYTKLGATQMRNLARGSVILFGSKRPGRAEFTVDTVFVVADFIDHSFRNYRRKLVGVIPETYTAVTLSPWYADVGGCAAQELSRTYRLYFGATIENPFDGMFSFFPCVSGGRICSGFARPTIHIPGVITPSMTQNKRLNPQQSLADVKLLWEEVVHQVLRHDLALGAFAALPRQVSPAT